MNAKTMTTLILTGTLMISAGVAVNAATVWTNDAENQKYSDPGNWTDGLPDADTRAYIDKSDEGEFPVIDDTMSMSQGGHDEIRVGREGDGRLDITGTDGDFHIGRFRNALDENISAVINQSGGSVVTERESRVGMAGDGLYHLSGGTFTANHHLRLAHGSEGDHGSGTFRVSGGVLNANGHIYTYYGQRYGDARFEVIGSDGVINTTNFLGTTRHGYKASLYAEIDSGGVSTIHCSEGARFQEGFELDLGFVDEPVYGTWVLMTWQDGLINDEGYISLADEVDDSIWSFNLDKDNMELTVTAAGETETGIVMIGDSKTPMSNSFAGMSIPYSQDFEDFESGTGPEVFGWSYTPGDASRILEPEELDWLEYPYADIYPVSDTSREKVLHLFETTGESRLLYFNVDMEEFEFPTVYFDAMIRLVAGNADLDDIEDDTKLALFINQDGNLELFHGGEDGGTEEFSIIEGDFEGGTWYRMTVLMRMDDAVESPFFKVLINGEPQAGDSEGFAEPSNDADFDGGEWFRFANPTAADSGKIGWVGFGGHGMLGEMVLSDGMPPERLFVTEFLEGGPFEPVSATQELTNPFAETKIYSATTHADWLTASDDIELSGGETGEITVKLNDNALYLPAADHYQTEIDFGERGTNDVVVSRVVQLAVTPSEVVIPGNYFAVDTPVTSIVNIFDETLSWTAEILFKDDDVDPWLTLDRGSGEIAGAGEANVELRLTENVLALPAGEYTALVEFKIDDEDTYARRKVRFDISAENRLAAFASLDQLKAATEDKVSVLLAILKDPEEAWEVRRAAFDALKKSGVAVKDIAPVLLDILKDTEDLDSARELAIEAVNEAGSVMHRHFDTEAVVTLRQLALPQAPAQLRSAAVEILDAINVDLPEETADWPMWRYDAARSAQTPVRLSEELHLQWRRELPEPKRAWQHQWDDRGTLDFDISYTPVVMGEKIFVPSNVTDSVTAYSIYDGSEFWRFYTDGPVRLAPAAWDNRVYFTSDDGHLYCVDAGTGELEWKFRAGPSDHRLLGNERIINYWAARGGPVIQDGTVYFAAGIFPLHGVFIYALDAETGEMEWVNDRTSSDYVQLPHGGASGYGGLSPQGYIAADLNKLAVAPGRGQSPVFLDRRSGEVTGYSFRGSKGGGGYAVHAEGQGFKRNDMIQNRLDSVSDQIDGEIFYQLAARDRLFVTAEDGTLYCFGPEKKEPRRYEYSPVSPRFGTTEWADTAAEIIELLDDDEGYALMLGAGSGGLLLELLGQSKMHIVVVEEDPEKVRSFRDKLSRTGMYGRRAAVIEAEPAAFSVQPYLFSLVVSENVAAAGIDASEQVMNHLLDRLRPYGGIAWLGAATEELSALAAAASAADVDQVSAEARGGHFLAARGGPLSDAGKWTHQYHDARNTNLSKDRRVQLPLGVLWYGGPNNHDILPRHSGGPRPQVAGGRQVYLGVETIGARCVYTGRRLWSREFPGIGHPFTNLKLEERWKGGRGVYMTNIPGATYIGSPFVTKADSVYLRYEGGIHRLDPATGETLDVFSLPGRPVSEIYDDEDIPDWGHHRVVGDYLITTSEPHILEDKEELPDGGRGGGRPDTRLGWTESYSGTSSRRIAVLDRYSGEVRGALTADIGFRHNAIAATEDTLFVIDGLSENALEMLARRGEKPKKPSRILAVDLATGEELWSVDSGVFGTFILYSEEYDILLEGGSSDLRFTLEDEPAGKTAARRGKTGELLWEGGSFTLPGALRDDMLIPGRPGNAISLVTGDTWRREQPYTGMESGWSYRRAYGCNTLNASWNLLLYRSGYAAYFDLKYDTGTGNFSGFRSGCTANMIAADGVLNALDYTRTCTCRYALQTSLAMIHMPDDSNIEFWTRFDASPPDPANHGLNFGAPGRRVDVAGSERVWHDRWGTFRRHPSAIKDNGGGGLDWVAASMREIKRNMPIKIVDLPDREYKVRLHFAELDEAVVTGQRVFDVLIDGEEVLSQYDIMERAGGPLRGVVESVSLETGGIMNVELRKSDVSEFNPVINGIEIIGR